MNDRLIVALTVLAILLTPWLAHSQTQQSQNGNGYSISSDGQITQWDSQGGHSSGPEGNSSWDTQTGGYAISPGGYSSWSGPTEPVLPAGPIGIIPDFPEQ